jgi:hypothetical protein
MSVKAAANCRKRSSVEDLTTKLWEPRSSMLTKAVEAMIEAFRRPTLLPLDDRL